MIGNQRGSVVEPAQDELQMPVHAQLLSPACVLLSEGARSSPRLPSEHTVPWKGPTPWPEQVTRWQRSCRTRSPRHSRVEPSRVTLRLWTRSLI